MISIVYWDGWASLFPSCVWIPSIFPKFTWARICCRLQGFFLFTRLQFQDKICAHPVVVPMPSPSMLSSSSRSIFWCSDHRFTAWWDLWTSKWSPVSWLSYNIPHSSFSPSYTQITFLWVTMCVLSWLRLWSLPISFSSSLSMRRSYGPSLWWWFSRGVPWWYRPGLAFKL